MMAKRGVALLLLACLIAGDEGQRIVIKVFWKVYVRAKRAIEC